MVKEFVSGAIRDGKVHPLLVGNFDEVGSLDSTRRTLNLNPKHV